MPQANLTDLEKFVVEYEKAGREWVEAKLAADQLENDQKSYLAALINELDDGGVSETKLDRQARGSKPYRDFVSGMCIARAEALRKRVRFDALGMLFEAARSNRAFERETLRKGIFHQGG